MSLREKMVMLKRNGFFSFIPDKVFYEIEFRMHCGGKMNWKNPKTFSEKMNWLKLYDRKDIYHTYVDKYAVRDFIKNKIGKEYLIPLIGVWNCPEEIEFENLPKQFVMKCTHDGGSVRIIHDKYSNEYTEALNYYRKRLKVNFFHYSGREWPYLGIKPRIMIEKYLMCTEQELINYKFFCFNGTPKFVQVEIGLTENHSLKWDFYDIEFNPTPFFREGYAKMERIEKPERFQEMLKISVKLSKDLPFLRVDLYEWENNLYFSEMTFYPGAGYVNFSPDNWNEKIGSWLELPLIFKQ